jgi:hypothetical protein
MPTFPLVFLTPAQSVFLLIAVSKEDMEKLRQALKTLSEAEKQLRMSNDKLTWLTAALLQLAPDQQYMLPASSDTSFTHSPLALNNAGGRDSAKRVGEHSGMPNKERTLSTNVRIENLHAGSSADFCGHGTHKGISLEKKRHVGNCMVHQQTSAYPAEVTKVNGRQNSGKSHRGIEDIWLEVLEKIQINGVKEFLYQEGKLISVSLGAGTPQYAFKIIHKCHY